MAGTKSTEPSAGTPGLPLRTIVVEVSEGPDAGRSAEGEALSIGTADDNDLRLEDATVSRYHLELRSDGDLVRVTDLRSTNGTLFHGARLREGSVPPGAVLDVGDSRLLVRAGGRVTVALHDGNELRGLYGRTPVMRRLMAQVQKAAGAASSVLLVGESGTGKELVARSLHDEGPRSAGPFVTVDCGTLSPSLVASELFGHERGAFTGAEGQHRGAFERAHGGTLFLDEIGELPPSLQPTLLGALERGRFRRVGGREEVRVDVRVVSATNRDLRAEVNRGQFRLDLYYRLAVVTLRVPPLRERSEDIPLLVAHFLREAGADEDAVPTSTIDTLCAHSWPGNVRELRNVVEATLIMGEAPPLHSDLGTPGPGSNLSDQSYKDARAQVLHDFEASYLPRLLERSGGNVSRAARLARMDRTYLIKLLNRHGLKPDR
ncbi:MAG: sigma 54-interacting transcriptional regulator [Myxococcota bacterium]